MTKQIEVKKTQECELKDTAKENFSIHEINHPTQIE